MDLRSAALSCQRTKNLLAYNAGNHGIAVENYLDDFMGAEVWEKAGDSYHCLFQAPPCAQYTPIVICCG